MFLEQCLIPSSFPVTRQPPTRGEAGRVVSGHHTTLEVAAELAVAQTTWTQARTSGMRRRSSRLAT
jgi:hypothetical protein